jgi:hypothetical protein
MLKIKITSNYRVKKEGIALNNAIPLKIVILFFI